MVTTLYLWRVTLLGILLQKSLASDLLIPLKVLGSTWSAVDKVSHRANTLVQCGAMFALHDSPKGVFRFDNESRTCEWPVPNYSKGMFLAPEDTGSEVTIYSPYELWDGSKWRKELYAG